VRAWVGARVSRILTREGTIIDAREVQRLVAKGEGQLLEFKPGSERPSELATSVAAFANASGGTLLLGVVERAGRPVVEGVADSKLALDHLYTAAGMCSPKLALAVPEEVRVGERLVLVVTIPEDQRHVYHVDGRYLRREGSFRRPLDVGEIRSLMNGRGVYAHDALRVLGATRDDLDDELVSAFAARFRSGDRMPADDLLLANGLLARPEGDSRGEPTPTVAGLLLLGKTPQQFLPQARVALVRYAGTTMGEKFLSRDLRGTVPAQLDEAVAWLMTNTLHAVELHGAARVDRGEYPEEVIREAVLNALAHRDYSLTGDRVRIYIFGADRIEVHSPGRLGGPMRLDNIATQRWSRNSTLVQGLAALDIIEEVGFGVDRMIAAMGDEGLSPPQFQETEGTFVVTVRGHGASLLAEPRREAEPTTEPQVATPGRRRLSPEERQAWVLNYVRTVGPLSPRDYVATVGIDRKTALTDLRALAERGLLQAHGTTTDRRYTLRDDMP